MADQEYVGEDSLDEIGSLKDIQIALPLMNPSKPKREKLQLVSMKLTNEPRGNGSDDAKGVFITSTFNVIGGENDGRDFTILTNADTRIAKGDQKSQFKSIAEPFLGGLVLAVHGSDQVQSFFMGVAQSQKTAVQDIVDKAATMAGMQFSADVGVRAAGSFTPKSGGAPIAFKEKQIIKAWHPKGQ